MGCRSVQSSCAIRAGGGEVVKVPALPLLQQARGWRAGCRGSLGTALGDTALALL